MQQSHPTLRHPIFLSIRNKATRLPGKSFVDLGGHPAVDRLIERLRWASQADGIVICTSTHPDDAVFADVAARQGVHCFRGSEDDKLDRYLRAAEAVGAEFAVVVDGDDILCDPHQIGRIIDAYHRSCEFEAAPLDYVVVDHLPVGATGFGIRIGALGRVCDLKAESDTEVWGGYFTQTGLFNVELLQPDDPLLVRPELRLTLDYPEDLAIFRRIFEHFGERRFGLAEAIAYLDSQPDVPAMIEAAQARYLRHLAESAPVRLAGAAQPDTVRGSE